MNIELLVKQSKFNKDTSTIIDIISPIICNKKITKREIDKANEALLAKFGIYQTYTNDNGTTNSVPNYTIAKWDNYGMSGIKIYTHDRYINIPKGDYSISEYLPEDYKTIYANDLGIIPPEDINKYKPGIKSTPTRLQIEASYKKYEELNTKIRELENKRSELPFHYYFK